MGEEDKRTAYELFLRIAKNLTMKLPLLKHRVIAAKWVRKIHNLIDVDYLEKAKYLRLLSLSLQSKILVGPFKQEPPKDDFDLGFIKIWEPVDIQSMIVDSFQKQNHVLPYHAEISGDLKEYLVYQEIPDFGSHFYYACSSDPITSWARKKYAIIPTGGLVPSALVPPLPIISKTKEEHVSEYNAYLKNVNQKKSRNETGDTPKKCQRPATGENRAKQKLMPVKKYEEDDYVDYRLIGHGSSVESPRLQAAGQTINQIKDEIPSRISFFVGDDPEPFFYELAVKECQKDKKGAGSNGDKIKALACEYLTLGAVDCERDALVKAREFLMRAGCI